MNDTIREHVRALTEQVDQVMQDGRSDDPLSSGPVVTIRTLRVSAIVEPLDARAGRILRRAVPTAARHHRPDGSVALSLARLPALHEALTVAGYVVRLDDEGPRR